MRPFMTERKIIARLQEAWGAETREDGRISYRPIAGSDQDQTTPDGIQNPMWDIIRWIPAEPNWNDKVLEPTSAYLAFGMGTARELEHLGAGRQHLATHYAWSIISPGDVAWISEQLDGRAVVEIGAGTGYWAWQLEQAGIDVAAYDPHPVGEDNSHCKAGPYTTVLRDDATAVKHHQDRALMMVWPPYGGNHARHALSVYTGDLLIYAGEPWGGCTADDGFYELLEDEWEEISVAPKHVTWWGIHCQLSAYTRRCRG